MPTTIGKPYSVDWHGAPPHMLTPDIPVWYRWLEKYQTYVKTLWYDVLLGGPFLDSEEMKDPFNRMWRYNNAKRADAIVETETELLIIEVSDDPGLRAVGQLQVYQTLWIEDPVINKPEKLLLVCGRIDPDVGAACGRFGILLYVV